MKTQDTINNIKRLAKQGDEKAIYDLGKIYYTGDGVTQDYIKALYWLKKAETSHTTATEYIQDLYFKIGQAFYNGDKGHPQDFKQSLYYFTQSAQCGNADAMAYLGKMYEQGQGTDKNIIKALEYWELASEKGHPNACELLPTIQTKAGIIYHTGNEHTAPNHKKAVELLTMASEHGQPQAMAYLGLMYAKGDGVPQDMEQAYFMDLDYFDTAKSYFYILWI